MIGFLVVTFVRMYGGPDDDDYYHYYNGTRNAHAFSLPAAAMITECTILLPMVGDISAPDSAEVAAANPRPGSPSA